MKMNRFERQLTVFFISDIEETYMGSLLIFFKDKAFSLVGIFSTFS